MPMNDVVRQAKERPTRFTRLGTIRLGWQEPNQSGSGSHPVAADHFVLKDAEDLVQWYGEKPKTLPIRFPYANFDDNITAWWQVWAGGVRVCEGDGDFVRSALPLKTGTTRKGNLSVRRDKGFRHVDRGIAVEDFKWGDRQFNRDDPVPCPGGRRDLYPHCPACTSNILLKVMIADIERPETFRFGYYQISSRSLGNYKHFLGIWRMITHEGEHNIPMDTVPFRMSVVPLSTLRFDADDQQWLKGENYFLQLEVDPIVARRINDAQQQAMLAQLSGGPVPRIAIGLPPGPGREQVPGEWLEDPPASPPLSPDEMDGVPFEGDGKPSLRFLDRSAMPKEWGDLYTLTAKVGIDKKTAWSIVKGMYPDATAQKPPTIEAAWQAVLDHEASRMAERGLELVDGEWVRSEDVTG